MTVTAARYDDGLLLDRGTPALADGADSQVVSREAQATVTLPQAGIYQVDVHTAATEKLPPVYGRSSPPPESPSATSRIRPSSPMRATRVSPPMSYCA